MSKPVENTYFPGIMKGVFKGAVIMLGQTPFVTSLNRISVVSCYKNISMYESIKQIFLGTIDHAPNPSLKHFLKGVSGHLTKETARLLFKSTAIVLKPTLDKKFKNDKAVSDLIFAGSLACAEVVINPADTLRTMWQAEKKIGDIAKGNVFSHLYKGSVANGLRQFGTWLGYPLSERMWSHVVDLAHIDSHSLYGNVIKSLPQSFQITAGVWMFERLKNELQYYPERKFTYVNVFTHLKKTQGWMGFMSGFLPKVLSNYILIIGTNYLLELGRALQKKS